MVQQITGRTTGRWVISLAVQAAWGWAVALPALAATSCPDAHQCFALPHAALAIPNAYISTHIPGFGALGNLAALVKSNPEEVWVSFWMPDGLPAASEREGGFFRYPDAFEPERPHMPPVPRSPPVANPRTRVDMLLCVKKEIVPWDCHESPDRLLMNMVHLWNMPPRPGHVSRPVDPAVAQAILDGTTSALINTDDIERFGAFHMFFGRVGCNGAACDVHFDLSVPRTVPYPPYSLSLGHYENKRLGLNGRVFMIALSEEHILAAADRVTGLIQGWVIGDNQDGTP